MAPMVYDYSTGIGIHGTEQRAQRVVKTDNKHGCADDLQILRHKTHPKFFASSNDKNGDEKDNEIAFQSQEISDGFQRAR